MNSVALVVFGLTAFALAYRFYSRFLADRVFGLDDERTTPAHAKQDNVDFVPTDRHVLFGHHFTSIAGAAPILGPAIAVIWGWVPALLWIVFGTILIGALHDFSALFVSTRNGGTTIADLTGKIVGKRARVLFLLLVFFLAWIVIAVFAVVIGSLFTNYPETVLPVNFEILVACAIGFVIYKLKAKLLGPSLVALVLLYVMVWVGAEYTKGFRLPVLFQPPAAARSGKLLSQENAPTRLIQGTQLAVALDGAEPVELTLPAAEGGPAVAAALQAAVRAQTPPAGADPSAWSGFACSWDPEAKRYTCVSGSQSEDSAVRFLPQAGTPRAPPLGLTSEGALAKPAVGAYKTGRVKTWVLLLLGYSFLASVLPVWLLLQPRDYINSHQLFVGLGAMYLGVLIYHPPLVAPAINTSPGPDTPFWFPFLFITIACGAISGFHGLVASGTTSKQVDRESDARMIGYGATLGEGTLALMALLACAAGFASSEEWHHHYASWGAAGGLGAKLGAFVKGGASFLHNGLGMPVAFAKAVIAVIVISFAATTLDTATRIQRFVFEELADTHQALHPLKNRYFAAAIAAFTPLLLVFGSNDAGPYWKALWPIFGACNQMLGCLVLLVVTFYLLRKQSRFWFVAGVPCLFLAGMTSFAMIQNLRAYLSGGKHLLAGLSLLLLVLSLWILLEGILTLRGLKAGPAAGEATLAAEELQ